VNRFVAGSKRASRSPCITAIQIVPSGATAGSRANFGVGTAHSVIFPAT
jgi:hypothetical protein